MSFAGMLYEFRLPRVSTNNIIALITLGLLFIVLALGYFKVKDNSGYIKFLVIFCLSIFVILRCIGMLSIEQHSKRLIGKIAIDTEYLLFNDTLIKWTSIEEASIKLTDYKRKFEWKGKSSFSSNLSSGIRNEIFIKTDTSVIISGNLLLESREDLKELKALLWHIVEKNRLPLSLATKIVDPESYQEHQRLKQYCS